MANTNTKVSWEGEVGQWLKPFLERLGHKSRQRLCPLYVAGLIGQVIARVFRRWPSDLRPVIMISCIILLPLASGMQLRWKQNFSSKPTNSSAAAMRCW